MNKPVPEPPPNIKEFSEITAVIFSQLYASSPVDRKLDLVKMANVPGLSNTNANCPSGRSFNDVFINTLGLLIREGFVDSYAAVQHQRCVLATKAMAVMGLAPPPLNQPFASELSEAIQAGNGKGRLAAFIGDFFGSFRLAFWKSIGS